MTDSDSTPAVSGAYEKRVARAAAIAAMQLQQAEAIVRANMSGLMPDERPIVVAAVLNAIALNMHASATAPKA